MVKVAFLYRGAIKDTCNDYPKLANLKLRPYKQQELANIYTLLKPFKEFTQFVLKESPTLQITARIYTSLYTTLTLIKRKEGLFKNFNHNLVHAIDKGLEKFDKYFKRIKSNNIYFITTVLDPRVKTQQISNNFDAIDARTIINRIKTFLKATYTHEPKLPECSPKDAYRSLKYRFLLLYTNKPNNTESNINRYFNTLRVKHRASVKDN